MRGGAFAAVGLFCAGAAFAQVNPPGTVDRSNTQGNWERQAEEKDWRESEFKLPEFPRAENLIEFEVSAANSFRFFIDSLSLWSGADGVVRYTLVARSISGIENVSYEAIRCKSGTHRVYAFGRASERTWSPARVQEWKEIPARTVGRQLNALRWEYFCPQNVPIATREEGIAALKRGGHPNSGSTRSAGGRP